MSDATYSVHDNGDLHRYRTEIPNIIFRLGLTPYELTLYAHLKQTAGDGGQCWKSTSTLAKETGMSTGTISKAKDGLVASRPELFGKSLIAVREEAGTRGGRPRHYITLTDVWPENMTMRGRVEEPTSATNTPSSPHELDGPQVHHMNFQVHHMNFPSSPHELKKEQSIKKEQREEESPQSHKNETTPPGATRAKKPSPVYLSPPTLPQVKEFCLGLGWPELAEEALDFQSQRGWQMKSGPVTDWPAALRTWKRTRDRYAAENGTRYPSRPSTPLVGGTLANAGHVQVKRPADWKPITLEEATRRDKEYAAQVAAKRQADALRNGS